MNPIQISQKLQQTLVSYLTTTFDVNRDNREPKLAATIRASLNAPGALFNGPFLELTPPYKTGRTLEDFIKAGTLSPQIRALPCFQQGMPIPLDAPLYTHQEASIIRLSDQKRSIVVSSGTGSGKTECFLIPILNDLLLDDTPGVRALLVYPMNALVNDQLDRLRRLLAGTSITFGRYTSELEQSEQRAREKLDFNPLPNEVICRDHIQSGEKIPQILITNYAMLEYLLLRPEDSRLFQGGLWRFIVLDEAHTYIGAQGVEVAMLLRRLKHRLGKQPGDIRCVATSATLTNNDADIAAQFAQNLFHETFTPDDVIFGEIDPHFAPTAKTTANIDPECYLHENFDRLLNDVRSEDSIDVDRIALRMNEIGLIEEDKIALADVANQTGPSFLWHVMKDNPHLITLRNWMLENDGKPVRPDEAAKYVFGEAITDADLRLLALYRLIELGAIARAQPDQPPLLPARYHLFMRPPQGMWACVNPECSRQTGLQGTGWSRLFSHRVEKCDVCGCQVYPIAVCRECGQVYLHMRENQTVLSPAQDDTSWSDGESRYFTWRPIRENLGLGQEIDEDEVLSIDEPSKLSQEKKEICVHCGEYAQRCRCDSRTVVTLWQVVEYQETKKGKQLLTKQQPLAFMNRCPRCYSTAQRDTEIVTPMTIAGTTPLAIITHELYRHLPSSPKQDIAAKPGNGRKLLTFYDSRQGAARFAAFLQDVTNQQNYRHIIPAAVKLLQAKEGELPDLEDLSRKCVELAWDHAIFHNDPDSEEWRRFSGHLSSSQRKRLMRKTYTEIIAEFTTRRNDRQSLETLGLISVEYFEDNEEALEFVTHLAESISFTPKQTLCLVNYLLDDLRKKKVIVLPDGVDRDDPVFGRHKFSPRLVRGGNAGQYEESWLGKTERKARRRLMGKMLKATGQSDTAGNIERALGLIFDWLVNDSDLLDGSAADGFQLRYDRLFFNHKAKWYRCDTCQRLSARGDSLPCPHPNCTGVMHPFETSEVENFYLDLFQRDIVPLRVEEHTAQLDAIKGRQYQDGFRDGNINVLSCSTTFEMGIDLGDLQAVAMSNVPPTVANYRQRAGRAGRRSSGTALILTWASDRPHDQTYFRDPLEIIQGHVRVPYIALDNELIRKRHVNAILLSEFLRYRYTAGHEELRRIGAFFDHQVADEPHFITVSRWLDNRRDQIHAVLAEFAALVGMSKDTQALDGWIKGFASSLQEINDYYQEVVGFYIQQIEIAQQSRKPGVINANKEARESEEFYEKLLIRLRDEYLINYLSDRGFLPSYSFPLHSVELLLPPHNDTEHLRLQRDLRQAIREYAPGSEVVADKRIWRSGGIQFYRETPRSQEYHICHFCGHLRIAPHPGKPLPDTDGECELCHTPYNNASRRVRSFLTPDGFRADWKRSGQPAKQYVVSTHGFERSALIPPPTQNEQQFSNSMLLYDYQRDGKLLYVNEGRHSKGYRICFDCGGVLDANDKTCKTKKRDKICSGSRIETIALGYVQQTDTLHLRFMPKPNVIVPSPDDRSFWLSMMYALIQGASRALQIERRDIDGVLYPRQLTNGQWEQSIVLYDDVPGGAGHVRQIINEFPRVIEEALVVLNCTDCDPETSCSHCLRDYNNQMAWGDLRRHNVLRFLEAVYADLKNDHTFAGEVVALNLPFWLMRQIENAHSAVWIAADDVSLLSPFGASRSWLDIFSDLLQREIAVTLYLKPFLIERSDSVRLSIAKHLRLLVERGLTLYWVDEMPFWQVVIDPEDNGRCRAIRASRSGAFCLDDNTGCEGLITTIMRDEVNIAYEEIRSVKREPVSVEALEAPPNINVINITSDHKSVTEAELFGEVFRLPVRTVTVNDPYLFDAERILKRLGAYIDLARHHGTLEKIIVQTKRAGQYNVPGSAEEQDRHFARLEARAGCPVQVVYHPKKVEHDRYIRIERQDGTQACILIGRGLDFIRSNGSVDPTYIVIQDPL